MIWNLFPDFDDMFSLNNTFTKILFVSEKKIYDSHKASRQWLPQI